MTVIYNCIKWSKLGSDMKVGPIVAVGLTHSSLSWRNNNRMSRNRIEYFIKCNVLTSYKVMREFASTPYWVTWDGATWDWCSDRRAGRVCNEGRDVDNCNVSHRFQPTAIDHESNLLSASKVTVWYAELTAYHINEYADRDHSRVGLHIIVLCNPLESRGNI